MTRRIAGALMALALLSCREQPARLEPSAGNKPRLSLLTSLPIVFGEGFSLQAEKHPLMARLERDFDVRLIDGPEELPARGLLLAAQPQALTAERLVALDNWVRRGGRVVLLADPRLDWPSELPLGDKRRPPQAFADTGLLAHWGLMLEADHMPALESVDRKLRQASVSVTAPGALSGGGDCRVQPDRFVARCKIGRGTAVVIADADFVGGPIEDGRNVLASELLALSR